MEFAIALAPGADSWKTVQRAERLGYTHAWFYDTQLLCADVFVALAAAAVNTTRIKLGPGVLIPSNRIAPSAACALASLNQLAPGRIVCGLGTGFTARRTMGLPAMRVGELREYLRLLRALLAGETPEWDFEGKRRRIRFLDPDAGRIDIRAPIPMYVSAFGPKAQALVGESAQGFLDFWLGPSVLGHAGKVRDAVRAAGRDPAGFPMVCFALGCVLGDGEDANGPRARAQAGPVAAVALHWLVEGEPADVPEPLRPVIDAYRKVYEGYPPDERYLCLHRGHLIAMRDDEAGFVNGDLIRATSLTGTPAELRDQFRALEAAGYTQVAIQVVPGQEDALEDWAQFMR